MIQSCQDWVTANSAMFARLIVDFAKEDATHMSESIWIMFAEYASFAIQEPMWGLLEGWELEGGSVEDAEDGKNC